MLTLWKRIVFSVGSLLSVGSATLLLVALSTQSWVTASLLCQTGADLVNASQPELAQFTGDLYFGLFRGGKTRRCGLGGRRASVHIFPRLIRKINYGIHLTVILFLFMAIGFALVSLAFCIYNARKVPYQAIKGPLGLYLWNLTAALFCSLALVGFIAAVHHHRLTECVANFREDIFHFVVLEKSLGFSFWLCVASAASHGTNILVVASSRIHMPKIQKKKPEVPTVTGEDLLY